MFVVSMENIYKSFGNNDVLRGISLSIEQGEVVAIIGASGGGKSTLLRCATLLETFESGKLAYGEIIVAQNDASGHAIYGSKQIQRQAKAQFGLVFQNFNLFPHYTVLKNIIDAPIRVQKREREEVIQQARLLIDQMGLQGKEDMVPCELSGGQQQRVAIARALCMDPKVLFFDEPTSALDPLLTQEVLKVIRELALNHMTMAIVTHEMGFAREVADRIVFMDGGQIIEDGPASDVIDNPKHEATRVFLSKVSRDKL